DKIATADAVPNCYNTSGVKYLNSGCVDVGPGWAELGYTTFSQKTNVDKATTQGIELAGRWQIINSLALSGNYTYTDSEQKSGNNKGLPLVNTPEHMANATLSWDATSKLNLSLITEARDELFRGTATTTGPQPETVELYYKSYVLNHLGASYKFDESLSFNARVNNVFDKDVSTRLCEPDGSGSWTCSNDYNVAEAGRSYWLSANYRFCPWTRPPHQRMTGPSRCECMLLVNP